MFTTNYNKRPIIENCQVVSVTNFVRSQLTIINQRRKEINQTALSLVEEEGVQKFADMVKNGGITINMKQERNGQFNYSKENPISITYTKSNLGKGFVVWFVCNNCSRKVRYLYFPAYSEVLACRQCHKLSYQKQNDNKRFRAFDKLLQSS